MQLPAHIATTNPHKHREFEEILGMSLTRVDLDLPEPQALDVRDVVSTKAQAAFDTLGSPVLVEDTGLAIHAWNGLPGALIKWFVQTVGDAGMLHMLAGENDRRATATCAIAFADSEGVHVVAGECPGTIATTVRGTSGFGWDPIFIPDGSTQTFAEMRPEEKHAVSHRRRALDQLRARAAQHSPR